MATTWRDIGTVMLVQLTNNLRQIHASLRILQSENVLMSMNVYMVNLGMYRSNVCACTAYSMIVCLLVCCFAIYIHTERVTLCYVNSRVCYFEDGGDQTSNDNHRPTCLKVLYNTM